MAIRKRAGARPRSPARKTRTPAKRFATGLGPERILDAAERVLRRVHLPGFSMRKLAEELGSTAMAIYRHFPNKAALLDAVVDRAMDGIALPTSRSGPWIDRSREIAWAYRKGLLDVPETVPWVLRRVGVSPGALRHYDAGLAIARESGLPDAEVVRVVDSVVSYVLGFVAIEVARRNQLETRRGYRAFVPYFTQLPVRDFPALVALAPHVGDFDDDLFAFGLDLLLAGAAARASRGRRKR